MKTKNLYIKIFVAIVILLLLSLLVRKVLQPKPIQFNSAPIRRGHLVTTVSATGKLQALTTVQVGAQVSGRIQKLFVDFNSKVKKGQRLAIIDPMILKSKLDEAQASYDSTKASLLNQQATLAASESRLKSSETSMNTYIADCSLAENNLSDAKIALSSAEAQFTKSSVKLQNAILEERRKKNLLQQDFISKSDYEAAYLNFKNAEADNEIAKNNLSQAKTAVATSELRLKSAKYKKESAQLDLDALRDTTEAGRQSVNQVLARLRQSTSQLEQAKVNLDYTVITSPVDGIVTQRAVDEGQTVASSFSTPTLFEIARDLSKMEVIASVDEADISKIKEGQQASFTVDAYPDFNFKGKVIQVRTAPTDTNGSITYQVVISANNDSLKLLPGMTANITILTAKISHCLKVPNIALRFHPELVKNFPYPHGYENLDGTNSKSKNRSGFMGFGFMGGPPPHPKTEPVKVGREDGAFGDDAKKSSEKKYTVWVLEDSGAVRPVKITTGMVGSSFSEVKKGDLKEEDRVIINVKNSTSKKK